MEQAGQGNWQPVEKDRQAWAEEVVHGERQRVGSRVRWKSMGWPHWGHRNLGRACSGIVSGWVSAEEVGAVSGVRCCCKAVRRRRCLAAKKP